MGKEAGMPAQVIKIVCPHCGKVRTVNPAVFGVSKGPPSAALEKAYQKKRESMLGSGQSKGSWINLRCPGCGKPYQYNSKTQKVRLKPG
jgi:ribosomal protein S27E